MLLINFIYLITNIRFKILKRYNVFNFTKLQTDKTLKTKKCTNEQRLIIIYFSFGI